MFQDDLRELQTKPSLMEAILDQAHDLWQLLIPLMLLLGL